MGDYVGGHGFGAGSERTAAARSLHSGSRARGCLVFRHRPWGQDAEAGRERVASGRAGFSPRNAARVARGKGAGKPRSPVGSGCD